MNFITSWTRSIGIQDWMVEISLVLIATLLISLAAGVILAKLQHRNARRDTRWDHVFLAAVSRPLQVLVWVVGLTLALQIAGRDTDAVAIEAAQPLRNIGVIVVLSWFLIRFINKGQDYVVTQRRQQGQTLDYTAVEAVAKLLRLIVGIIAVLVTMQTLGFSIAGVLTFGGIGGIAIGFAARDLLANFFGGFMIYMDRPFSVGNWIRSPDREIEGTVEDIGWRITRIRTFDSRPLYVPNATFTSIALENPSRMHNRRIFETVGIRYDDAGRMRDIVADVKDMLVNHESIDQDQTLMVNFDVFAASSLDFFVYCFTRTTAWVEYHEIKQDVLLKIVDIIEKHGAECAFPTSTVHLFNAAGGGEAAPAEA